MFKKALKLAKVSVDQAALFSREAEDPCVDIHKDINVLLDIHVDFNVFIDRDGYQ